MRKHSREAIFGIEKYHRSVHNQVEGEGWGAGRHINLTGTRSDKLGGGCNQRKVTQPLIRIKAQYSPEQRIEFISSLLHNCTMCSQLKQYKH